MYVFISGNKIDQTKYDANIFSHLFYTLKLDFQTLVLKSPYYINQCLCCKNVIF